MKVIEFEKNSEDWREFRVGKSGGSEFDSLYFAGLPLVGLMKERLDELQIDYTKTAKAPELASLLSPDDLAKLKLTAEPKKRYYEMVAERCARPITPNDYEDRLNGATFSMMQRGHILEPEAIAKFNEATKLKADPRCVVWVRDDNPNIYISPDATIADKDGKVRQAVEVKCLSNAETVKAYLTAKYPSEYNPQIIKYFVVNDELEKLYFVLYTDTIPGLELQTFEIKRSDIAPYIAEARAFEDEIMRRIEADAKSIEELAF